MKYIALTIGPIYKTLKNAKKTRELWGGSYIFSYIMKNLIEEFKDREFIVPYIKDKTIFDKGNEVGLFHDRFIFKAKDKDLEKLKNRIAEVIHFLSKDSSIDEKFLKNYFQINYIEKELKESDNPILKLSPYLDTKELFFETFQYKKNKLQLFLKDRLNNSFLVKDAFGKSRISFPSLPEIAMYDLKDKIDIKKYINSDDELNIYKKEEIKKLLKRYHKYIAIVQADGDNMGKVVEQLKSQEDFNEFSKKLFEFCKKSHQTIKKYGGQTIFAGGDDLLFFAPVVSKDKTIFNLCDELSKIFSEKFENYNTKPKPSLSFGVSITYNKFPLYEALESARGLLFAKAKSGNKNAIAFKVIKHSGQEFGTTIPKGLKEVYDNFIVFTSNINGSEDMDNFLHSIHHKIDTYKDIINLIGKDKNKVANFFENYFNEQEHKAYKSFFKALTDFIVAVYKEEAIRKEEKLNLIYGSLRFVKFIKGDKE